MFCSWEHLGNTLLQVLLGVDPYPPTPYILKVVVRPVNLPQLLFKPPPFSFWFPFEQAEPYGCPTPQDDRRPVALCQVKLCSTAHRSMPLQVNPGI